METALQVILSPALEVLFDRMAKPEFLNLFRKPKFDDGIVKKLKWKLLIVQGVLEDAENKQNKNPAVKEWLEELQEVVYQADDLLDLINTEALRVKIESQYRSPTTQVSASTDSSNFSVEFIKDMMPKLEEIVRQLEEFEQKIHMLGLTKEVESKRQPFRLSSTSLVDESDVFGRDADREKIFQALFSNAAERGKFSVISVVGLGGVGKTTLAQLIYNDARVKFDKKAWVCISEEYDPVRITKELLTALNISFGSHEGFDSLQVKLKQCLSNSKFLLVLDDMWNREYKDWLELSAPFRGGKEGSKIIATTRDEKVALTMGSQYIHHLEPISDEDKCWSLFKEHAFSNRISYGNLDSEYESIGKVIVKKCGGLPLAIITVAGLLRSKETIQEWDEILGSDEWDQPNNKGGILPSLRLSYNHLPSQLKRCFAYCAVFHKDYKFTKDEVVRLWMANDMLKISRSNNRLEDIGEEFLNELKVRSLFQESSHGEFCMHDLVNDLAQSVSGKHIARLDQDHLQSSVTRHFSYLKSSTDFSVEKFEPINQLKFLRTFLPLDFHERTYVAEELSLKFLVEVLPTFKSLRVLSLSGYKITELIDSFANLKQLRLLNLSFTNIEKLPSWICTFYNLQTLLLRYCYNLKELPEDMEKLINLRYLDLSWTQLTKMPMGMGRLENLQLILQNFNVSKNSGSNIEELGKLSNLHGELSISGLENVVNGKSASMAKMKDKKYIKQLRLWWECDCDNSQVANDVLQQLKPHSNIECIYIEGYRGTRFPNWLEDRTSFCHIVSLCFSSCKNCYQLPAIGQLPSLKDLSICGLSKVRKMGPEIYGNCCVAKPFPCLKKLKIIYMEEFKEWHIPGNRVFSCLEELEIYDCPNLIGEIPMQLPALRRCGIYHCPRLTVENISIQLPSLEELEIEYCPGLNFFDSHADFSSLRTLQIKGMRNIKLSLDLNRVFPHLEELCVEGCEEMVSFPICGLPTALKCLQIEDVGNLELEICETCHMSLEVLKIRSIRGVSVKNLPFGLFPTLRSLTLYQISNVEELSIPTSLRSLQIVGCDKLMSLTTEGGLPAPNLTRMRLIFLPKLKLLLERMHALLPSLIELTLYNCPEIECFPEGGFRTLPSFSNSVTYDNREDETFSREDFLLHSALTRLSLQRRHGLKWTSPTPHLPSVSLHRGFPKVPGFYRKDCLPSSLD